MVIFHNSYAKLPEGNHGECFGNLAMGCGKWWNNELKERCDGWWGRLCSTQTKLQFSGNCWFGTKSYLQSNNWLYQMGWAPQLKLLLQLLPILACPIQRNHHPNHYQNSGSIILELTIKIVLWVSNPPMSLSLWVKSTPMKSVMFIG